MIAEGRLNAGVPPLQCRAENGKVGGRGIPPLKTFEVMPQGSWDDEIGRFLVQVVCVPSSPLPRFRRIFFVEGTESLTKFDFLVTSHILEEE